MRPPFFSFFILISLFCLSSEAGQPRRAYCGMIIDYSYLKSKKGDVAIAKFWDKGTGYWVDGTSPLMTGSTISEFRTVGRAGVETDRARVVALTRQIESSMGLGQRICFAYPTDTVGNPSMDPVPVNSVVAEFGPDDKTIMSKFSNQL